MITPNPIPGGIVTQVPSVGRIVHYVSHGTPVREDGSQAYTSQCRAADITEVDPNATTYRVGLMVKNPTGLFFHSIADGGSDYDLGVRRADRVDWSCDGLHHQGGTWHWPERV